MTSEQLHAPTDGRTDGRPFLRDFVCIAQFSVEKYISSRGVFRTGRLELEAGVHVTSQCTDPANLTSSTTRQVT